MVGMGVSEHDHNLPIGRQLQVRQKGGEAESSVDHQVEALARDPPHVASKHICDAGLSQHGNARGELGSRPPSPGDG